MDTIADMGGMQGMGSTKLNDPFEGPFDEEWQKRAFAMALLSMRTSGTNLDTFRWALARQHPLDYLLDGYYGRWLNCAINLLTDSAIIAPGAVEARARKMMGEDVEEPPVPEPNKPDYKPTAAGSIRKIDDPPKFKVGDRVRAKLMSPAGHTRLARYVRGHTGVVRALHPAQVLPDTNAHFLGENAQHVYNVEFDSHDLWGPEAEKFTVNFDLYESYIEETV
ncbi:MAG TPA: nitrile hydratase subunit beta [Actinomycetota bacterium]|nr:nitrile hydratase subunit beta [Actinomycetota bacterium]